MEIIMAAGMLFWQIRTLKPNALRPLCCGSLQLFAQKARTIACVFEPSGQ